MAWYTTPCLVLSWGGFALTHVTLLYWLNFLLNDPFNIGGTTIDARVVLPAGKCSSDVGLLFRNIFVFLATWWLPHSLLARKLTKKALGLWQHPLQRPIFAFQAPIAWFVSIHLWTPWSNCSRWVPTETPFVVAVVSGSLIAVFLLFVVAYLYYLPDHVFGTRWHEHPPGKAGEHYKLIKGFPYSVVRHPAAAGFLWTYWLIPSYTANHILLAFLWSVFIVVGTLVFEEGGIDRAKASKKSDEKVLDGYDKYRSHVYAFLPTPSSLSWTLQPSKCPF